MLREKGDKERTVFFTSETAFALMMYSSVRKNPNHSDHYFLNDLTHEPITYDCLYRMFHRLARKVNIPTKFSPHQWRHAAARSWLCAGMNLKTVSEILGHYSEQVTGDIYGTLDENELQQLYNLTMVKILHNK